MAVSLEKKVGITFFAGIILLIVLVLTVSKFHPFRKGYELKVQFHYVGGLREGDEVRLAGLKVGEVTGLEMIGENIVVTLWIRPGVKIRRGSRFTIEPTSIMGGKHIGITMGSISEPALPPGKLVQGIDPPQINEIISQATEVSAMIKDLVSSFNATQEQLTRKISEIIDVNQQGVERLIEVFNDLGPRLADVLDSINDIAQEVLKGEGTVGKLLREDEAYRESVEAMKEARKAARELNQILAEVKPLLTKTLKSIDEITEKVNKGEGTIGKLLTSEEMYQKAEEVVQSTQEVSREVKKAIDKFNDIHTYLGYRGDYSLRKAEMRNRLYLRIEPSSSKYYLLGVSKLGFDPKEGEEYQPKFDLELAKGIKERVIFRGGMLESRPGAGVDFLWRDGKGKTSLETYFQEEGKPLYFRVRNSYHIWKNYYLTWGGEDLFDNASFTVGFKLEYEDRDIKYLIGALGAAR